MHFKQMKFLNNQFSLQACICIRPAYQVIDFNPYLSFRTSAGPWGNQMSVTH